MAVGKSGVPSKSYEENVAEAAKGGGTVVLVFAAFFIALSLLVWMVAVSSNTPKGSLVEEAEHQMYIKAQKATPETFFKDRGIFAPDSLTHEELMNFYERMQKNEELEAAFSSVVRHMRKRLTAYGRTWEVHHPVGLGGRSYVSGDGATIWIDIHASDEEIIRQLTLPEETEAPKQERQQE